MKRSPLQEEPNDLAANVAKVGRGVPDQNGLLVPVHIVRRSERMERWEIYTFDKKKPLEVSITNILQTLNNQLNKVSLIEDYSESGKIKNPLILPTENKNYINFTRIENNKNK